MAAVYLVLFDGNGALILNAVDGFTLRYQLLPE